jgi:hypothetical protein
MRQDYWVRFAVLCIAHQFMMVWLQLHTSWDKGIKFIEMLQYADSLKLGCVLHAIKIKIMHSRRQSEDVLECQVTNPFIYKREQRRK